MRVMERNKSVYWYLLYDRKEPVKDEEGHETGDTRVIYKEAVKRRIMFPPQPVQLRWNSLAISSPMTR